MENKAHYALIGAFVLVALGAAMAFIVWLSGAQFNQQFDQYEVSFNGPVRGLSQGSEVRFNGLNVGSVTALRLDPNDPNRVLADIEVDTATPVDTKSYARLEPLGLTGLTYIQIFSGGEGYPLLKDLPGKGTRQIKGQMSQIDTFLDDGGSVIEGAQKALNRINATLSPEAIEDFQGILVNLRRVTGDLDTSEFDMQALNQMMRDFSKAGKAVTTAADAVTTTAGSVDDVFKEDLTELAARLQETLNEVDKTLGSFDTAATGADELIVDARDAINRLSNSGLTDLEETIDAIRRVVISLGRVADSIEQNPGQFISGSQRETVEIPQ
ncbi:MlaD family protein [Litorimonas sp. RW-G-Af-16]|uniref:MlaD family protein n=1 Tax=Litorimonas sp. RW-G-Af-16 TaxID=3241168 RepID=UPI00390CA42D